MDDSGQKVTLIRPLRGHLLPRREKARAADSRPYGRYRNCLFFRRGRTLAGPQMYAARPGGRALQGAETSTGGHMGPPLQSGWQPAPSSASHSLGTFPPRGRLSGDRKGRPYGVSSTSTVGSVKPGAEFESHRMQFWGSQAPVGREETRAATQILRAGIFAKLLRRGPRNGGLGESRHRRTKFASAASPSVFWFLFHGEKELAPQGETL